MKLKHTDDPVCLRCNEMLINCREELGAWFSRMKAEHPYLHVSCGWRGELEQNECFANGLSNAKWPLSPHNATTSDGKPMSRAIDLFLQIGGVGSFPHSLYVELASKMDPCMVWGGSFKDLKDGPHFEISQ